MRGIGSVLLSFAFVLCWSSGFIGAKLGASEFPATTVLMWRFLALAVLLAPALVAPIIRTRRRGAAVHLRTLGRESLIGALSQAGYLLTVFWAIGLGVRTGTTALIDGIQPLVVAALVGPLLGVAVTRVQWVGLALGLAGVITVVAADATSATSAPLWAYPIPFIGMTCLVTATFIDRRSDTATPPLQALAIHCTASAIICTLIAVSTGTAVPPAAAQFWFALAWLIGLSTFGGYGLYWYLLRRHGVTRVNTLMFLVPPVTALWGAAAFQEPFTAATAAGLAIALVATWIVTRATARSASADPPPSRSAPAAPLAETPHPGAPPAGAAPGYRGATRRASRCGRGRQ